MYRVYTPSVARVPSAGTRFEAGRRPAEEASKYNTELLYKVFAL